MAYSPPLDGAAGLVLAYFLLYGIVAFVVATFVESIILWRSGWGSSLDALLTSFIMNLASTIVGYILTSFFFPNFAEDAFVTIGDGVFFLLFLLLFFLSLGLEGAIMWGMSRSRHQARKIWQMAIIANVVSYILIGIGFIYAW